MITACITCCIPLTATAALTKVDYGLQAETKYNINDTTLSYIRYHVNKWIRFKAPNGHTISSTIVCKINRTPATLDTIKYAIDDELAKDPLALSTVYHTNFRIAANNRMEFSIYNICLFKNQWRYEQQVKQVINPILKQTENMSDKEKLMFFHDWICENTAYDFKAIQTFVTYDNSHAWTAYGVFVDKQAVCLGYARAFQILCLLSDIDCEIIYSNGNRWHSGHAYNLVHLNGQILYVDVCSDDNSKSYNHDYFLKTKNEMCLTPMSCFYTNANETADMTNIYRSWKNYLLRDSSYISPQHLPVTNNVSVSAL